MPPTTQPTVSRDGSAARGMSRELSDELARSFAEDGYFVVRNVVSKEKLALLRSVIIGEFEGMKRSGRLFSGGGAISGHLNCFPGEVSRFAYEALEEHGIVDLIKAICRRPLAHPNVGCNLNLPGSVVQHYHVDSSFTADFMIANIAVVDTDLANGAIELVPGTHKKFYKFWRFATERPHRFGRRVSMNQGDVLVRTSTLWHRGMPNRTNLPRPMLAFTFVETGDDEKRPDPFLLNEGRIMFYENWYRPNFLGRLRERTFVAAPFTYSAYRFVRSLIGNKGYDVP
jgi:ectoine hydroxylase-related dioxygenase (phytanoyl-CoA dioxygenase family)